MPKTNIRSLEVVGTELSKGDQSRHFSLDSLLKYYRTMLLIRRFEERAAQLYGMGIIAGFCHLYIGQEAVVTGIQDALSEQDTVITSYRDHGHMLACGMEPRRVMAELAGRKDGYSKGKGGSMHMFSTTQNFYGGHGIVGSQVGLGTGLAFAHKYKEDGGVCTCYLGDGAMNQGQIYESFNMASLWSLPVVYIIENNKYSMGTSQQRSSVGELCYRGQPYHIPAVQVDGMNVLEVNIAAREWLAYTRDGKGPCILEVLTYRYRGHSMSDPAKYRTRQEVEKVKSESDPIDALRKYLLTHAAQTEESLKKIDQEIRTIISEAAEFAQKNPEPDPEELWTDVLIEIAK